MTGPCAAVQRTPRRPDGIDVCAKEAGEVVFVHSDVSWGQSLRLRDVLARVEPVDGANYVMVESFGTAQSMRDGRPVEPYYTVLTKDMAMEDETILAWGINDGPLPEMYGAPLRLRTESMHGYKMVKWVRSVSWITD